jgi:hypothetical protein
VTPGVPLGPAAERRPPLSATEFRRLAGLAARLPLAWTATPRRRRLLLLALAAPGFLLVAATPLHRSLGLLALGFGLFAAAMVFRRRTEGVFARAEAAALWPPSPACHFSPVREPPHA